MKFYKLYLKTNQLIMDDLEKSAMENISETSKFILFRFISLKFLKITPENFTWKSINESFKKADNITGDFTSLFKRDLKDLNIENPEIFENMEKLFNFDIDYKILGLLFERNLKSKRKKHGVFYTPDYITDYISKNTIIPYLSISGNLKTVKDLISEYENKDLLKEKLKALKILDPSCGSGAFLIKSCEVLYEIYDAIYDEVDLNLILNNIYGVDLSEKSCEITKLSLFIKLSKYGSNFNCKTLNNHIRSGDSLIDDKKISNKAFKWSEKFDIVITNPPYVNIYKLSSNKKKLSYYKTHYTSAFKKFDLYVLFIEKGIDLLKQNGKLCYILPDSFTNHPYGLKIRKLILNNTKINKIIDLTQFNIFKHVSNSLIIMFLEKTRVNEDNIVEIKKPKKAHTLNETSSNTIHQSVFKNLKDYSIRLKLNDDNIDIINKIKNKSIELGEICYITSGTRSIPQSKFHLTEKLNENSKKLIVGKNIEEYYLNYDNLWLDYDKKNLYNPMFPELFENEKIIIRDISPDGKIYATYDNDNYYTSHTVSCCLLKHSISERFEESEVLFSKDFDLKYILALISSKLSQFYFKILISSSMHVYVNDLKQLPVIALDKNSQNKFVYMVDEILKINEEIYDEINNFHNFLGLDKVSRKLKKYYLLDLDVFKRELLRKNIKITSDIENHFNISKDKIKPLLLNLDDVKNNLDKAVYELYDLTSDEIEIIEKTHIDV